MSTLVHQLLADSAARTPDAVLLIDEHGGTMTYRALDQLANRFGHALINRGVGRGDRVVIALENGAEFIAAYIGTMKAGAVAVPLAPGPRNDRFAHAIADCEPRLCVIDDQTARASLPALAGVTAILVAKGRADLPDSRFTSIDEALSTASDRAPAVRCIDLDLAAIIYTSGSTGDPRGVMLTHRNFIANARSIVRYLRLTAADRVMCVLPFNYVYGLSLLHTHVAVGASMVVDNRFTFPNIVLDAMRRHAVTGFAGVPSTFALLLHRSNLAQVPLPHLRYVTQAGGNMPVSQIQDWLERLPAPAFYVMYGATEAAARLTYLPPEALSRKLGSVGRAIPNVDIQVVTQSGDTAAVGEVGEVVARGSNISCGYWNQPVESAARFTPRGYRTGDLGYKDDEGYLYLVGRQHDMIKVGAHRVGAKEIEDILCSHEAILEAAVVAAPHQLLGEAPVAFVALKSPLDDVQNVLRAFCAARMASYKVPVRIVVQADLPKLPGAGKLDRRSLKAISETMRLESVP